MMRPRGGWRPVLAVAGLIMLLVPVAYGAPIGALKQFRVPTRNSSPLHITQGSDGNFWFTEGFVNPPQGVGPHNIGRITPSGDITEFAVCDFCFPNDIVQGPNGILYFTKSDPALGRITTSGQVLPDIPMPNSLANGNGIAAQGDDIWFAAFNTNSIWRYNVTSEQFTEFPLSTQNGSPIPFDIAVDANGIVWFTEFGVNQIGRLDPQTGAITETFLTGSPRGIAIAADRAMYEALCAGDYQGWRQTPLATIEDCGQQEMLNWMCLVGAMAELGRRPDETDFIQSYIFNSNKVFAFFKP